MAVCHSGRMKKPPYALVRRGLRKRFPIRCSPKIGKDFRIVCNMARAWGRASVPLPCLARKLPLAPPFRAFPGSGALTLPAGEVRTLSQKMRGSGRVGSEGEPDARVEDENSFHVEFLSFQPKRARISRVAHAKGESRARIASGRALRSIMCFILTFLFCRVPSRQ